MLYAPGLTAGISGLGVVIQGYRVDVGTLVGISILGIMVYGGVDGMHNDPWLRWRAHGFPSQHPSRWRADMNTPHTKSVPMRVKEPRSLVRQSWAQRPLVVR